MCIFKPHITISVLFIYLKEIQWKKPDNKSVICYFSFSILFESLKKKDVYGVVEDPGNWNQAIDCKNFAKSKIK